MRRGIFLHGQRTIDAHLRQVAYAFPEMRFKRRKSLDFFPARSHFPDRRMQTDNAGRVIGARAQVLFLAAAGRLRNQPDRFPADQRTHAFGAMDLMAAECIEIHPHSPHVHRYAHEALNAVYMNDHIFVFCARHAGNLLDRLGDHPAVTFHIPAYGVPYIIHLSVPGYKSETLLHFLAQKDIYVSSGSACSKGAKSPVLTAMGLPVAEIDSALRVSLCRDNTEEEMDCFVNGLCEAMAQLASRKEQKNG